MNIESGHEEIVFLTVMTGKINARNDHADVNTAKQWTGRFHLDPEQLIAAELWYKTGWEAWTETGKKAKWMS